VALAEALALGVPVGAAVAEGVADGLVLVLGVGEGAGVCPEPVLAGKAVRRWLVDAWIAVRAAMATTKMTTQSPATATHRRRRTGRPARRLLQDSRLDAGAGAGAGAGTGAGSGAGRLGRVASALDQSVRRAATATRRSWSFVRRSDARYRVDPTEAITLAIAVPMSVPATPKVEEIRAADTAASALAATWVKLGRWWVRGGRSGVGEGPGSVDAMIGADFLLFWRHFGRFSALQRDGTLR
jgi:hypothetical protein